VHLRQVVRLFKRHVFARNRNRGSRGDAKDPERSRQWPLEGPVRDFAGMSLLIALTVLARSLMPIHAWMSVERARTSATFPKVEFTGWQAIPVFVGSRMAPEGSRIAPALRSWSIHPEDCN